MRHLLPIAMASATILMVGCNKADDKNADAKPDVVDIAPQRTQLQQAKDLEKKMQQDAEDQRKIIEVQSK
jgi:hypothetical protein